MIAPAHARHRLFGIDVDSLTKDQAAEKVLEWTEGEFDRCRVVVTPNTDHVVQLHAGGALDAAYRRADLIVADGMPVVLASRLLGKGLPERVTGADLVESVFAKAACPKKLRVYLFGAGPGVADRAAAKVADRWEGVEVVGTACPPVGFEKDAALNDRYVAEINATRPDLLVLGLGAPKQEIWAETQRDRLRAKVALCVGATIDFLAGEKPRAPLWMQRSGLEWLHRLASEPKRLFRRYATDAVVFPRIVYREWRRTAAHAR